MSTRATYKFESREGVHTIYCHHDGYPAGAAAKFYSTLISPSKGNLATQFIRANDGAELTASHEIHGDTDFTYTITGQGPDATVCVSKRDYDAPSGAKEWVGVCICSLASFVDRLRRRQRSKQAATSQRLQAQDARRGRALAGRTRSLEHQNCQFHCVVKLAIRVNLARLANTNLKKSSQLTLHEH